MFSGDFSSFIYQPVLRLYFYVGGFSRILRMDHFVDLIKKNTMSTKEVEVPFFKNNIFDVFNSLFLEPLNLFKMEQTARSKLFLSFNLNKTFKTSVCQICMKHSQRIYLDCECPAMPGPFYFFFEWNKNHELQ